MIIVHYYYVRRGSKEEEKNASPKIEIIKTAFFLASDIPQG